MNNFEKIKQMTVEEMAKQLLFYMDCDFCPAKSTFCLFGCHKHIKQWLLQEVEQ
jgi:hypothetical protein